MCTFADIISNALVIVNLFNQNWLILLSHQLCIQRVYWRGIVLSNHNLKLAHSITSKLSNETSFSHV
jgi:hypothetical protein